MVKILRINSDKTVSIWSASPGGDYFYYSLQIFEWGRQQFDSGQVLNSRFELVENTDPLLVRDMYKFSDLNDILIFCLRWGIDDV